MLSADYCIGTSPTGRGVWRFNSILLHNHQFCDVLTKTLIDVYPHLADYGSIQEQWEHIKHLTRKIAKKFSSRYIAWRKKRLRFYKATAMTFYGINHQWPREYNSYRPSKMKSSNCNKTWWILLNFDLDYAGAKTVNYPQANYKEL